MEGIQPVRQAAEAGFVLDTLLVAPELLRAESAARFVAAQEDAGVHVARLSAELFTRLSGREGPTGLAAIVATTAPPLESVPVPDVATYLVLDRLGNPGNLGTILRTADAAGVPAVLLLGPTADPWDPAAVKASMGAVFHVPVVRLDDEDTLYRWAREHRISVAATAPRAEQRVWDLDPPPRLALLLGPEGEGLDEQSLRRADLQVSLPMVGTAESLNVAVAAGILTYEVWHRRAGAGA